MSTPATPPIFASIRGRHRDPAPWAGTPVATLARGLAVVALGLAVGALTVWGQARLHGLTTALVNSESAWLIAPCLAGSFARRRRWAACVGAVCCLAQLAGYDAVSQLERGFGVGTAYDVFWGVAAGLAGPLFGLAGHLWRRGAPGVRGLGPAALAAAFLAEGVWTYLHVLHRPVTAALWIAIGGALAVGGLRGARGWRWLAVTLPLAFVVELLVSRVASGWAW